MTDKTVVSGIVERKYSSITKAGVTYGIVVNNTKYGFFTTNPPCNEGDSVTFAAKANGDFWNADAKSLKLLTPSASNARTPGSPSPAAPSTKSWVPDKDRQDSIIFQSARKDSLEFLKLLHSKDLIDLGKSKSKGGMIEAMEIFLDKYTQRFFEDTKQLGHSESKPEPPETEDAPFADALPY